MDWYDDFKRHCWISEGCLLNVPYIYLSGLLLQTGREWDEREWEQQQSFLDEARKTEESSTTINSFPHWTKPASESRTGLDLSWQLILSVLINDSMSLFPLSPQVLITIYWLGRQAQCGRLYDGPNLNFKAFEGLLGTALYKVKLSICFIILSCNQNYLNHRQYQLSFSRGKTTKKYH